MVPSEVNYRKAVAKIEELEERLHNSLSREARLLQELDAQGEEAGGMARASMAIRVEDVAQLDEYRETNKQLIEFIERIANGGRTKFRDEARDLLGYE